MKTKLDSKNLESATKQDFINLAQNMDQKFGYTNKDIESLGASMTDRFEVVENELGGVIQSVSSLEIKIVQLNDTVATMQDKILKKLDDLEIDNTVGTEQYRRVHITLETHEKRIKSLENAKN